MVLKLDSKIVGVNKEVVRDAEGDVTLKRTILFAMIQSERDPHNTSVEDLIKYRRLFNKIDSAETEIELKSDEVVLIKEICRTKLTKFMASSIMLLLAEAEPA